MTTNRCGSGAASRRAWPALAAAIATTTLLALACDAGAQTTDYSAANPWGTATWRMQLRSTAYAFQTVPPLGSDIDRLGAYQEIDGSITGLAQGHLAFRASGRVADDLQLKARGTTAERLYTGHLEGRWGRSLKARLGRQFVQEGPTGLTLDGLWLQARPTRLLTVHAFGGARAPLSRTPEAGKLDKDGAYGLRATYKPVRQVEVSGSAVYRERNGIVAERPLGMEATVVPWHGLRAQGRISYDLTGKRWARTEALGQWQPRPDLPTFSVQTIDRYPDVDAASYFARFGAFHRIRATRASLLYEHRTRFGGEIEYLGTFVEQRTSTHIGAAFLFPYGRVGYAQRIGDAGEESNWYGYAGYRVLRWLQLDAGGALATYALLKDAPEDQEQDLTTLFGRARVLVRQGVRLHAEVQRVDNPVYSSDVRLLLGLDLDMGRGASRFGLDRGGWLQ